MKLKVIVLSIFVLLSEFGWSQNIDEIKTKKGTIQIQPILHGSLALTFNEQTILVDPYGGSKLYQDFKNPTIILITDIHGDHLDLKTLNSINTSNSIFIVPQAVADKLPENYKKQITVIKNGQGIHRSGIFIKALPMYNLPETSDSRHPKGRGNGYLLSINDKQIYISGDTEDIEEMRMLRNIDIAFVCMNLPYTMDIYKAAEAVLEFEPKIIYPFHYRGKDGLSDVAEFKDMVTSNNPNIEVRLRNWYPKN